MIALVNARPANFLDFVLFLVMGGTILFGVCGTAKMQRLAWAFTKWAGWVALCAGFGIAGLSLVVCIGMYLLWPGYPQELYFLAASAFVPGLIYGFIGYVFFAVGDGIPKQDQ